MSEQSVSRTRDLASRTLTAGQLIAALSKVHPDTPVVMSQEDEPCGDYGVRSVDVREMQRDGRYAEGPFGWDTFHSHVSGGYGTTPKEWWKGDSYDAPRDVVFLEKELEWKPIVDGEVGQAALPAAGLGG